jgi:hypothetical protein
MGETRNCRRLAALARTRRTFLLLDSWTCTVLKLAFTSLAFSLTTAPLNDNHFFVSSSSHIHRSFHFFKEEVMTTYTSNFCSSLD